MITGAIIRVIHGSERKSQLTLHRASAGLCCNLAKVLRIDTQKIIAQIRLRMIQHVQRIEANLQAL